MNALRAKDPLITTFKGSVEAPINSEERPSRAGSGVAAVDGAGCTFVDLLGTRSREQFVGHTAESSLPTTS